jgi:ethanolamine utilization protein EutA
VGLDVGTTSTQLIFSKLDVENKAGNFSVPEMAIAHRTILYNSDIHFTPLLTGDLVDAAALRQIIQSEYQNAGISRESVDTGAIIITGETSRKENAEAVLHELSGFAGDFVVATAGPDLESVLAAKGSGAVSYSESTGKTVLHMDIGGGTSNLALIRNGIIVATGCLNVGGRLLKFDKNHRITYISPVLKGLCDLTLGDTVTAAQLEPLASRLTSALVMAAGLQEPTDLLTHLTTPGTIMIPPAEKLTLSFSGGVADCISQEISWDTFGDLGPILGQTIRRSNLCNNFILGEETIRATVIGAGCHSAQLSGSTVFHQNIPFPLKNLPVIPLDASSTDDEWSVLSIPSIPYPSYSQIQSLAEKLTSTHTEKPLLICLEQDMAKALGQALALRLPQDTPILCIDRVKLPEGSYLDIAAPVGPALPVVVKTLVLSR